MDFPVSKLSAPENWIRPLRPIPAGRKPTRNAQQRRDDRRAKRDAETYLRAARAPNKG